MNIHTTTYPAHDLCEKGHHRKRAYTTTSLFRTVKAAISLFVALLILNTHAASAQVDCPANPHWTATNPPINADHVFCGEINNGAKGFHSRPGGVNPATVENFIIMQQPNDNGIYGGTVTLVNNNGANPSKFSTMFPDSCTKSQVTNSVLYAHNNPQGCPAGAPHWATCGMNRPEAGSSAGYCVGNDADSRFSIAFSTLGDGRINTAFPLR